MQYASILATFFLMRDESDPSIDYNHPDYQSRPISEYLVESYKFLDSLEYLFTHINDAVDEVSITLVVYDAAKKFDEKNVRNFFKRIYQLLSHSDNGPRLPTFIYLLGPSMFISVMKEKLQDPLGLYR